MLNEKLRSFQEFIDYKFENEDLLSQSLTTPRLGNEIGKPSYEFLETLGDAVIKIIFILKLYKIGIKNPGEITKVKANLESDNVLNKVANKISLEEYILKSENEKVKGTRILADIFEAICGALFLDSENNLDMVEEKMINPFYEDINTIIENTKEMSKNQLLEFLQERFKTNIKIKLEYEKRGYEHDPQWVAKNPQIVEGDKKRELLTLPKDLKSNAFGNKKATKDDIYIKILNYLKKNEHEIFP